MCSEKLLSILQQLAHLLRSNGYAEQADYVSAVQTIAEWDSTAIAPSLASGAMWGGSGAVWEVGEFETDDDRRRYWRLLRDLVEEMRVHGIEDDRANAISDVLRGWIASDI